MRTVDIYRAADLFVTVKLDENSLQSKTIMGENEVRLQFRMDHYVDFKINDYCTVYGEKYVLNKQPAARKTSTYIYEYNLIFQAEGFELARAQFLFLGADNLLRESAFSLMGNAETFVDLVLQNVARISDEWEKGSIISTPYKNLTFSKDNCYNALARIAEEFDTEFWIDGKKIHIVKRQKDTGFVFKHGKNKGLYEITRLNLNDSNIVTKLFVNGSDKNLPAWYSNFSKFLKLPGFNPCLVSAVTATVVDNGDGTSDFTFNWTVPVSAGITAIQVEYRLTGSADPWTESAGAVASPRLIDDLPNGTYDFRFRSLGGSCDGEVTEIIEVSATFTDPVLLNQPQLYIEKNTDLYGVIEDTVFFDDIYPHRTGIVTAVDAGNIYHFTDADIDFDVNDQLLPGLDAKVTFNTGQLAGYTFKIKEFNNVTKEFTILKNEDEKIIDVPNSLLKPAIGDEYVLIDINMPQSYIEAAEEALLDKATALLETASQPQVSYQVAVDPVYLKQQNKKLSIGDLVWIVDEPMEIQRKIRITNTTRPLLNEWQYQITLADVVTPTTIAQLINNQITSDRDITNVQNQVNNNSILNNNAIGDLRILQGTLVAEDIPETPSMTGFSELVYEDASGKFYKKI